MRIWVFTVWMLCGIVVAQTSAKPLHADRVVVLKKERTLQLLSEGKVLKSYKVALGGDPLGPKARQGIIRLRRESTLSIRGMRTANSQSYSHFVSERARSCGCESEWRFSGWGRVCAWIAEWVWVGWRFAPGEGLDGWVHCSNGSGD
jgi:hypothetical protein